MSLEKYTESMVIPSRTKYQLRNFVIGQHDTPAMQWRQIVIEGQDLAYKIRMAELSIEKAQINAERLMASGDPIDAIEAEEQLLGALLTQKVLAGAKCEFQWLKEIAEEVGPFTHEDIELDQPEYWTRRLRRQADIDQFAASQAISVGNVQSMLNAGIIKHGDSILLTPEELE